MRRLFSDGINSAAHLAFGAMGNNLVAILFVAYQLTNYSNKKDELAADMLEFLVGWVLGALA